MTDVADAKLTLFFDFISPYAYVAHTQVHAIAQRTGRRVELVPVLFAAILDAHGQKGPAEIPAKRLYTFKDAFRKAHRHGLGGLVPPPSHPFNPLLALRVASVPMADDARHALVASIFDTAWRRGEAIDGVSGVTAAIERAGLDAKALLEAAGAAENKERLRTHTSEAIARGVFGVPTTDVDGELFWGTDGLEFVEAYLRGDDPLPRDLSWAERPASATRPGSRKA
ncbi:2-hydroxychromene-2-carboxylate isomerase [Labilithrix luteola]|uniref:2-hydroxychromene-2-carboxylate isomerase n=1 Tax=Labilithrix luteola TaxID=1391654 RepID=A0A0K1Q561_9BACT|nr:2-hydroxychromene-2-carboxylate isomerase [Labilithrix luteola]AKV00787.1 2-hydroxychromene-2-carboxylate isomerase [Labilithrix luteola]